jgi:hypothetical protein
MNQKLDVAKIEAALRRAAYKALHGTREERSGRFLLKENRQSVRNSRVNAPKKASWRKS